MPQLLKTSVARMPKAGEAQDLTGFLGLAGLVQCLRRGHAVQDGQSIAMEAKLLQSARLGQETIHQVERLAHRCCLLAARSDGITGLRRPHYNAGLRASKPNSKYPRARSFPRTNLFPLW